MPICAPNAEVLAIDPSIAETGWAVFAMGELRGAGLAHLPPSWRLKTRAERCDAMARTIRAGALGVGCQHPGDCVIEMPVVRNILSAGSKGDPNDLILLAVLCGAIAHDQLVSDARVTLVKPEEWKGQTPKDITTERAKSRLSPSEIARVQLPSAAGLAHNVWDAIGIGLWAIGR